MKRSVLFKFLCAAVCFAVLFAMLASCNTGGSNSASESGPTFSDSTQDTDSSGTDSSAPTDSSDSVGPSKPDEEEPVITGGYSFRPVISEEMPIVRIDTEDGRDDFVTVPNRDSKLRGEIEYVNASITVEDGGVLIDGAAAKVKARGNYTLDYEKKPIRIKFDKKQGMLGLSGGQKFKSWVLLADWKDLSMSNNTTALYLGKTILGSDGYYASDYRNVEVYINGEY